MIEQTINIKPLSVNRAWKGKRFKTKEYKSFENEMLLKIKKQGNYNNPIWIELEFGFSSKLADIDNPIKMTLDILQKKFGFNDRDITRLLVIKKIVAKGNEYIKFEIQ